VTSLVLLITVCLLFEGLYTGSEMVIVAADRNRLHERARRGEKGAASALALLERPEKAIAVCLTGTNFFVVLSSVAVTSTLLPAFGDGASWIAAAVVTPLVVLFGEILPKSVAVTRADRLVVPATRLVRATRWILFPVVEPAFLLGQGVARLFGGGTEGGGGSPDREELRLLLQASREDTDMAPEERVMVRRVFRFGERRVRDIYRPLAEVAAIPAGVTCREAAREAARHGYSRYPVYRDRPDRVTGFLHVLDVVGQPPDSSIQPLVRKCLFVPEVMPVDDLMRRFRTAGTSFASVVDEFGGVSGIVTAEDVVEEVVGEIEDEYDEEVDYHGKAGEREFTVPGRLDVVRLEEMTGLSLPKGEYASVGGMVTALAERIPSEGESFEAGGALFTVVRATERAVKQVRVRLPEPGAGGPESPAPGDDGSTGE
jgi:CBS domain containing-hemolysin-like protein